MKARSKKGVKCAGILPLLLLVLLVVAGCAGIAAINSSQPVAATPSITVQPTNQIVSTGQSATFGVVATGTAPLSYQWRKNGAAIAAAISPSYTTPTTTSADNGAQFSVVVSNSAGSVTSSAAALTVNAPATPPAIATQPASQTVTAGQPATFSVVATGTAPLAYQWQKNNSGISGATSSTYTLSPTSASETGAQFAVVVSNSAGSVTSSSAMLTVSPASSQLQVTTSQLPSGTTGKSYSATLSASGGSPPYAWSLSSGTLPSGLSLSSSGTITGTPASGGSFAFAVQVKDGASNSASANLSISVAAPSPAVTITSPASGATVSGTVSVSGTASDSVSISSVQVAVDGGTYSAATGTSSWTSSLNSGPLSNGAHTLTAQVTDSAGASATSSAVSITVNNVTGASDCTIYASPSGGGSGASSSSPTSFSAAASATGPGSVVCLMGGTYNLSSTFVPPNSGTASSWITYKAYGDSPANFVWTGPADAEAIIKVGSGSFPSGPAYIIFQGLNLNGSGTAADGFFCSGGHHVNFVSNSVSDTGGAGIGSLNCDYIVADHNLLNHNGYIPSSTSVPQYYSWTSAISFNSHAWFDNYLGIHSVISNNIITGEVDQSSHHTDGNGIILDLGGNTPPALILNNVVYGNGGTCIIANQVQNFYTINNTCYDNDLDPSEPGFSEFASNGSSNGYIVNNISFSWNSNNPTYGDYGGSANNTYYRDLMFGAGTDFTYSDPSQFLQADPLFLAAPVEALGGFVSSLAPSLLGNDLTLPPLLSPALGKGIDASAISGLSSSIASDLKKYIYADINGKARPQGAGCDLGAYQH